MYRMLLTIAFLMSATPFAECAPPCPEAALAWANASPSRSDVKACAALAWAAAKPCECDGTTPDCPCKLNPKGLIWKPAPKGDVNFGQVMYLYEPEKCEKGKPCIPEKVIGGVTLSSGEYHPFDGKKWGKRSDVPADAPAPTAKEAAAIIAAGLIGLVSTEADDCPPGSVCARQQTMWFAGNPIPTATSGPAFTTVGAASGFSSGTSYSSVVVVGEVQRMGPLRRIFGAPFRAIRAMRSQRFAYYVEPSQQVESATVGATVTTYAWQPTATYTLQPVTETIPITRYQWVQTAPQLPAKPAK